jgi:flagellar biosynthesis protein FliR
VLPSANPAEFLSEWLGIQISDLSAWGLAWARVTPALTIVPAFGLSALPAPSRAALGLAMAIAIAPALHPIDADAQPYALSLVLQVVEGLPVAIAAALALWTAAMVGGLADNLRGAGQAAALPNVEDGASPLGALLSMLVAILFLESGGAARVAAALSATPARSGFGVPVLAHALTASIELSIAVAAPVVAASIVSELASALVARAATPAHVQALLAPLRTIVVLGIFALVLDRMAELLTIIALRLV